MNNSGMKLDSCKNCSKEIVLYPFNIGWVHTSTRIKQCRVSHLPVSKRNLVHFAEPEKQ
jgi:hypothetical protein